MVLGLNFDKHSDNASNKSLFADRSFTKVVPSTYADLRERMLE